MTAMLIPRFTKGDTMRTALFISVGLGLTIFTATARSAPLPGTPLSGSFGTIDITEPPEVPVPDPSVQPFEFVPGTTQLPIFSLPGPVTEGDLIMLEVPTSEVTPVSDVVRFTNVQNASGSLDGEAILFSDTDEAHGGFGLGALPGGPLPNQQTVDEVTEPTIYQVPGATYRVFSDAVPEPSTVLMLGAGVVGLALSGRRKRS